jgi:hypothetical protein
MWQTDMCLLLGLYFYPEDGGNIFLRDVDAIERKTHPCMTEDKALHFLCQLSVVMFVFNLSKNSK